MSNIEATLQSIPLTQLQPHPDNPRLIQREDVIESIRAQLEDSGVFSPEHALRVRPVNGHYQIIEGHHRAEAAKRAGLQEVPCWVKPMPDPEAYMQLALGNSQGELSPLELGVHALGVIELGSGGRGITGGLREYARVTGRTAQYIGQVRQAAEVYRAVKTTKSTLGFLDKSQHLAAIHQAPQETWAILAEWMLDGDKSVKQVEEIVKQVAKYNVPTLWAHVFLPLDMLTRSMVSGGVPTAAQVKELVYAADSVKAVILSNQRSLDRFTYTVRAFYSWLRGGVGTYAWDIKALQEYRDRVIQAALEAQKPPKADAQLGTWYRLGTHLLYCGDTSAPEFWEHLPQVPFAFADPPYNADVAEWDSGFRWQHDWLTDKAAIVAITPGIASIQSFFALATAMPYRWSLAAWIDNGMTRGALGFGNWIYIALFSDKQELGRNAQDVLKCSIRPSDKEPAYKGKKPSELLRQLLELFTAQGDTVIDPFLGSGTTLQVADELGRRCIGGEIQPEMCNVIIDSWQQRTGQRAEVAANGSN